MLGHKGNNGDLCAMARPLDEYELTLHEVKKIEAAIKQLTELYEASRKLMQKKGVKTVRIKKRGFDHMRDAVVSFYDQMNPQEKLPEIPEVSDDRKVTETKS